MGLPILDAISEFRFDRLALAIGVGTFSGERALIIAQNRLNCATKPELYESRCDCSDDNFFK